jgi:hypothetical protein
VHILCECEALASLRHQYLGSFFWDPEDIRVLGVGAIWNFIKEQGFYNPAQNGGHKGSVLRPRCIGSGEGPYRNYDSIIFYSILTVILCWWPRCVHISRPPT